MFPEYQENSVFHYSADEAWLESFSRAITDYKEGRVYPAKEWLEELRRTQESNINADTTVG